MIHLFSKQYYIFSFLVMPVVIIINGRSHFDLNLWFLDQLSLLNHQKVVIWFKLQQTVNFVSYFQGSTIYLVFWLCRLSLSSIDVVILICIVDFLTGYHYYIITLSQSSKLIQSVAFKGSHHLIVVVIEIFSVIIEYGINQISLLIAKFLSYYLKKQKNCIIWD